MVESYKKLYDALKGDAGALTMCTIPMLFASEIPIYVFTLLDYLALPSLYKYRLHYADAPHLGARVYPPWDVVKAVSKVSHFNFLFAYVVPGSLAIWASSKLKIFVYDTDREITWRRLLREAFMISLVADFMFYWLHRLLHIGQLYLTFHKKHHGPKLSFAMVHHYMTYKEALIFALPQALPPLILWGALGHRMHVTSMWFSFVFTQLAAVFGHAGWKVPWPTWVPVLKPSYHDHHHVAFDTNFGAIYELWDWVFGTLAQANLATPEQIVASLAQKPHDYAKAAVEAHGWPRFP